MQYFTLMQSLYQSSYIWSGQALTLTDPVFTVRSLLKMRTGPLKGGTPHTTIYQFSAVPILCTKLPFPSLNQLEQSQANLPKAQSMQSHHNRLLVVTMLDTQLAISQHHPTHLNSPRLYSLHPPQEQPIQSHHNHKFNRNPAAIGERAARQV